jgi:hypothetical protein
MLSLNMSAFGGTPQHPAQRRSGQSVHFPPNHASVSFPFEFLANAVFIPVKVNGKGPYLFYVDTGASDAIIASEEASKFGVHSKSMGSSMGAGSDSYAMGNVAGTVEFALPGGLTISTDRAVTISMAGTWPMIGQRVYGNIGREILKHFIVEFDYEKKMITFYDPAKFHYAGKGQRFPSPIRGQVVAPGGEPIASEFSVDTGAGGTIVTAPLVKENHLMERVSQKVPSPSHGIGNGVSDDVVGRITQLRLGTYAVAQPLVALSQDTEGSLAHDAFVNMGGNILSRFTVTIDYIHHEVILEPNGHFAEPFAADASGLVVEAHGEDFRTFTVKGVVAGSPSDKAGIKANDIITEIDRAPVGKYALWELQDLLKESGTERSITIKRDGKTMTVRIKLQALA